MAADLYVAAFGPSHPAVATMYHNLAAIFIAQRDGAKALECYLKALEIKLIAFGPASVSLASTYNGMAGAFLLEGHHAMALEYYNKALEIRLASLGSLHPDIATTYCGMALVYEAQGDFVKALAYCRKALEIEIFAFGSDSSSAGTYKLMANSYHEQGDYAKALENYGKALERCLSANGPRHPHVAQIYGSIANVYNAQGDCTKALAYCDKALEIDLTIFGSVHLEVATTYNNMAIAYLIQSHHAKALQYFGNALDIRLATLGQRHPEVAMTYNNMAAVYFMQSDFTKALWYFGNALDIRLATLGQRHPDIATTYSFMALATCSEGDTPAGLRLFRQALDAVAIGESAWDCTGRTLRALPDVPQYLFSLSKAEASDTSRPERVRLSAALKTAEVGLDMLSRLRASLSKESRQFFEEKYRELPGWALYLQHELEKLGESVDKAATLRAAEMASSVSFMEMMAEARVATAGALPDTVASEELNLLARIMWLDDHASDTSLLPERAAIEDTWTAFVDRLHCEQPRYATLKYPRPATLEQASAALAPDEVALEYVLGKYGAFLVAVSRDSFAFYELGTEADVKTCIAAANSEISGRTRGARFNTATVGPTEELYRLLLGQVEPMIRGKRLIIVPSGELEAISFEALKTPSGRYLAEEHVIQYAPSLAIMILTRQWSRENPAASRRLFALGNAVYDRSDTPAATRAATYSDTERSGLSPLPGTETEVRAITLLFPTADKRVLMSDSATEENVAREDWHNYGYLHFACHGALEAGLGRQPALVLSQIGNREPYDGFLTLSEVISHPHRARLSVLSACNSGRSGATQARTGVSSLARAFQLTGSDAVIVSLWSVDDDATAALMTRVYRTLREENVTPGEALRRAQAELRGMRGLRGEDWFDPYYWAAFICVGE